MQFNSQNVETLFIYLISDNFVESQDHFFHISIITTKRVKDFLRLLDGVFNAIVLFFDVWPPYEYF